MEYRKLDLGTYKLHMIKTDKFKTIRVKVSFRRPIKKSEVTIRNILCNVLSQSTKNHKTKRELIIKSQDLYATTISSSNTRIGNFINTDVSMIVLNDKYTEVGNYERALEFLKEVIYNPNVEDNKFSEDALDIVKAQAKTSLETIKEDASYYSVIRLLETMDSEGPTTCRMTGYIEDLDSINTSNLYKYYKSMIEKDLMDIFVVGNIDFEETEEVMKSYFPIKTFKKRKAKYLVDSVKPRRRKQFITETLENNQSKLAIGCRMVGLTDYERNYPLTLYNIILGSGTDSKLFREVREKHSLCYTISSVPNKLDNILLIREGVDRKNIKKSVSLIEDQMNLMKKGKFTDSDINIAKEYFQTALDSVVESEASMIENYFMMDLMGLDDIDVRRRKMNEVSKSDIIKVAKKIKMDTVFCIEGVNK